MGALRSSLTFQGLRPVISAATGASATTEGVLVSGWAWTGSWAQKASSGIVRPGRINGAAWGVLGWPSRACVARSWWPSRACVARWPLPRLTGLWTAWARPGAARHTLRATRCACTPAPNQPTPPWRSLGLLHEPLAKPRGPYSMGKGTRGHRSTATGSHPSGLPSSRLGSLGLRPRLGGSRWAAAAGGVPARAAARAVGRHGGPPPWPQPGADGVEQERRSEAEDGAGAGLSGSADLRRCRAPWAGPGCRRQLTPGSVGPCGRAQHSCGACDRRC